MGGVARAPGRAQRFTDVEPQRDPGRLRGGLSGAAEKTGGEAPGNGTEPWFLLGPPYIHPGWGVGIWYPPGEEVPKTQ